MTQYSPVKMALQNQLNELLRAAEIERSLNTPGNADWEGKAAESEDDEVLSGVEGLKKMKSMKSGLPLT